VRISPVAQTCEEFIFVFDLRSNVLFVKGIKNLFVHESFSY